MMTQPPISVAFSGIQAHFGNVSFFEGSDKLRETPRSRQERASLNID